MGFWFPAVAFGVETTLRLGETLIGGREEFFFCLFCFCLKFLRTGVSVVSFLDVLSELSDESAGAADGVPVSGL